MPSSANSQIERKFTIQHHANLFTTLFHSIDPRIIQCHRWLSHTGAYIHKKMLNDADASYVQMEGVVDTDKMCGHRSNHSKQLS